MQKFLTQALFQSNWKGPEINESNWTILVAKKLKDINWNKAVEDTRPFIEKPSDLKLLTKEKVFNTLKSRKL